jgi:hypothetical protein
MLFDLLLAIALLFGPDVDRSNDLAALLMVRQDCTADLLEDDPDAICRDRVAAALDAIADRESPGTYAAELSFVGIHARDSRWSTRLWKKGHERGILSTWCPAHWFPFGTSTVGPHGLMYVYNVGRLGVPENCVPWRLLGLPMGSAVAATDRYLQRCTGSSSDSGRGWCPSEKQIELARKRRAVRKRR